MKPRERHWFEPIADHLGAAYLRYSFTKGTPQEVAFLVDELGLEPGSRVLDVGSGPGRHAVALAARGVRVVAIDLSWRFVSLGAAGDSDARFVQADARALPIRDESFDAAVSLCQGAFGLLGGPGADPGGEARVLEAMARAVRPGGNVVVSARSRRTSRCATSTRRMTSTLPPACTTSTRPCATKHGDAAPVELWTTCFTPRELRLLAADAGLRVDDVWSVEPGHYGRNPPGLDSAEFLVKATKASGSLSGR